MKYYLIFLLLLPLHSLSQHGVISATKMNMLYIGVENPVSFAFEGIKCSELTLAIQNGSLKRTAECDYDVTVTKPGSATLFILKGKDTLSRTIYRVANIPDPVLDDYWQMKLVPLDSLRSQTGLQTTIRNFIYDGKFSIVSFMITVVRGKKLDGSKVYCAECFKKIEGDYYEVVFSATNEGANFNNQVKAFVQTKLMPGDRIFLDEIKVKGPDNRIRQLATTEIKVQ